MASGQRQTPGQEQGGVRERGWCHLPRRRLRARAAGPRGAPSLAELAGMRAAEAPGPGDSIRAQPRPHHLQAQRLAGSTRAAGSRSR